MYHAVKNFLHNELGITREWITGRLDDFVRGKVSTYLEHEMRHGWLEKLVHKAVENAVAQYVRNHVEIRPTSVTFEVLVGAKESPR